MNDHSSGVLLSNLAKTDPNIAVSVIWEEDPTFEWDGDFEHPEEQGMLAYGVEVKCSAIRKGQFITGSAFLEGCYALPDEFDAEIGGYFPQMLQEALENLKKVLAVQS